MNDPEKTKIEDLTPNQDMLIALLLAGVSIPGAAKEIGVAEKTVRRWLQLAHFQRAYKDAQRSLFEENLSGLKTGIGDAVSILKNIAKDTEIPASTRVRAVQIWLEQAIGLDKLEVLQSRVEQLEHLVQEAEGHANIRRVK